jgi:putative transposase
MVIVHAANIQDRDDAMLFLGKARGKFPRLQLIWADGGYAGKLIDRVKLFCGWILEIIKRNDDVKGFQVLPHRWVAERTFG